MIKVYDQKFDEEFSGTTSSMYKPKSKMEFMRPSFEREELGGLGFPLDIIGWDHFSSQMK